MASGPSRLAQEHQNHIAILEDSNNGGRRRAGQSIRSFIIDG